MSAIFALTTACGVEPMGTVNLCFRNWSTQDGLPHNRVRLVIRTRDGFIWLATDCGAVRFDGENFKTLGVGEGLPTPVVLALCESADGTLWIGTLGGGLCAYRNGRIERVYTIADDLPSNWISWIDIDANGQLVVDTLKGMVRMRDGRFTPITVDSKTDEPVVNVQLDVSGTRFGLDGRSFLRRWEEGEWKVDKTIGAGRVEAMTLAPDGQLWLISNHRLWQHNRSGWRSYEIPDHGVENAVSLAVGPEETVWLAYKRMGLFGFKNGQFFTPAPTANFLPDMVESVVSTGDRQIWITSSEGLIRMTKNNIQTLVINDPSTPRASNNLGGLLETVPGEFLVATQGSGFYRWKAGNSTRLNADPLLASGVYGNILYRGRDGVIWLGGSKGLFEMNPDGKIRLQSFPSENHVSAWALAETDEGLWIGCMNGELFLRRNGVIEAVRYGGKDDRLPIRSIIADAKGDLWLGTRGNGLFRKKDGEWQRLGHESGLLSEVIRTLYLDPKGRVWVGTDGGGLALQSPQGFISATKKNGLPSDSVSQIVMDDAGRLWLGTHRGLAVLDQQAVDAIVSGNPGNLHPILINRADGLPAEEFTIVPPIKTSDGNFAFATVSGFVRLHPEDFQADQSRPKAFIEKITANGDVQSAATGKLELPAGTERLEFEFAGLFFADPGRLKFRNRLKGVENEWTYVGNRRNADYRNLGPGTYHFEVEATTGNGLWSASPATVKLTIPRLFWQTIWFRTILGLGAFGLVVWIIRRVERNRARQRIEIMRRRRAVDSERARIARDLHDDVGAGLTQMALQSQLAERNVTRQPEMAIKSMQDVFKAARDMTRALDEIIWAVNPMHDTLENFISFLGTFTQDFTESVGLSCRFDLPDEVPDQIMPAVCRHHLYLSSKEILHNVVKHAEATEVSLKVTLDEGFCCINIRDNGCGVGDLPLSPGADGLENLQTRMANLGGSCRRIPTAGQGTTIELKVGMDWKNEYKSLRNRN